MHVPNNPLNPRRVSGPRPLSPGFALGLTAVCIALCAPRASAQTEYSSLLNPILPAATLPLAPPAPVRGAADDYQTTLAGTQTTFELRTLQFFGGVEFTGPADGINNVLNFRFLNADGAIPNPVVSFPVAFATSGSFLYTISLGANGIPANSFIPTNGIIEITTLANSNAVGTWAFTNTAPTIGTNNAGNSGIRVFSLSSSAAPEPGSAALLLLGAVAVPGAALARRRRA